MNKDGLTLTIEHYRLYVMENMPESWRRAALNHNVLEQLIEAVARYCLEHRLKGSELYYHLHENELICAASFDSEPQGIDWWMDISSEASMLENHGCINTYAEDEENSNTNEV